LTLDLEYNAIVDGWRMKFLNVNDVHSRLCMTIRA
jgi:hypothetical protein